MNWNDIVDIINHEAERFVDRVIFLIILEILWDDGGYAESWWATVPNGRVTDISEVWDRYHHQEKEGVRRIPTKS